MSYLYKAFLAIIIFSTIFLIDGCTTRYIPPEDTVGQLCAQEAEALKNQCLQEADTDEKICIQNEWDNAEEPYKAALSQWETDYDIGYNRFQDALDRYQRKKRELDECWEKYQQQYDEWEQNENRRKERWERRYKTLRNYEPHAKPIRLCPYSEWDFDKYGGEGYPGNEKPKKEDFVTKRPEKKDFVNEERCHDRLKNESKNCWRVYKSAHKACGGRIEEKPFFQE